MLKNKFQKVRALNCSVFFFLFFSAHISMGQNIETDTTIAFQLLKEATELTQKKKYNQSDEKAWKAAQLFKKHQLWDPWYDCLYAIADNGDFGGNYQRTIQFFQVAEKDIPKDSLDLLGSILSNLGYFFDLMGDVNNTLFYNLKSAQVLEKLNHKDDLNILYNNLGINYTERGDYGKAYQYLYKAINLNIELKDDYETSKNYYNLYHIFNTTQQYDKAINYLNKAFQSYDFGNDDFNTSIAILENARENHSKALQFINKVNNKNELVYYTKAQILSSLKHYQKAKKHYQKAIALGQKNLNPHHRELGKIYYHFGQMLEEIGSLDEALYHYQKAILTFVPTFTDENVQVNPSIKTFTSEIWLMEALQSKGDIFYQKFETSNDEAFLDLAIENYDLAIQFIEKIKLEYEADQSKYFLGDYVIPFYEKLMAAYLKKQTLTDNFDGKEKAFEIAQKNKAFVLREMVSERDAMKLGGISESKMEAFNDLNNEFAQIEIAIASANENSKDSLMSLRFDIDQKRQRMKQSFLENYPKYNKLRYDLNPVSISEIQAVIDANSIVVNYFQGEGNLYIFTITQNNFEVYTLPYSTNFREQIQHFRRSTSDYDFVNDSTDIAEKQFLESAQKLYNFLLKKPLKSFENQGIERLIIIPDGYLNHISFDVLLYKSVENWLDQRGFLLNKYAISYAYYSKLLTQESESKTNFETPFAGFGLEYDDYTLQQVKKLEKDSIENPFLPQPFRSGKLTKLPFSDDEVLKIAELLDGKAWTNEAVTKSLFTQNIHNAQIIHIASHGHVDLKYPENSGIIFTKTLADSNHILRLPELYNLDLSADMVVLSACNTGFGPLQRSEGLMSLARAFNAAGAPSVLASLWSIPDNSTYQIMQLYYENLKAGQTKDEALQQAKLSYLNDDKLSSPATRLPIHWAATSALGDVDKLSFSNGNFWLIGIGLIGFLGLGWVFFRRFQ